MTLPRQLFVLLFVYCLVVSSLPVASGKPFVVSGYDGPHEQEKADQPHGLSFRLSEVSAQPVATPAPNVVVAAPLSLVETNRVLDRLPPMTDDAVEQPFKLRERSLPPPKTGKTIKVSFPGEEGPAAPRVSNQPLTVLRYSPEGAVSTAPPLSITFSQPMVALSSQEEAAARVPVKLTPAVPGKWRWLGTSTLVFEPERRFPMATAYSVVVPAGTRSQNGIALTRPRAWTFTTPPPTIKTTNISEDEPQRRDKIVFIEFDQRINPEAVLKKIKLRADDTELRTRLATDEEIGADEELRRLVSSAVKEHWIAFRAVNSAGGTSMALPSDSSIEISVEPGTPSAEGPRSTTKQQELSFSTYGPLRLTKHKCGYGDGQACLPYSNFELTFSNQIETVQSEQVRIEPAIPEVKLSQYSNVLNIAGMKTPNTQYKVTVTSLRDIFGQNLEKETSVVFKTGPYTPMLSLGQKQLVVLDQAGPPTFPLHSVGVEKALVEMYSVEPEDWPAFAHHKRSTVHNNPGSSSLPKPPGRLVQSKELTIATPGDYTETVIDLSPALKQKPGHVIVRVLSTSPEAFPRSSSEVVWIQSTRIGLDAFVDGEQLIGWATSLTDGSPLRGVQLRLHPDQRQVTADVDGLARFPLPAQMDAHKAVLIARAGDDVAILPETTRWWDSKSEWQRRAAPDSLRWYVFDDRSLYRPGEEVHVKGWIRRVGENHRGDIGPLGIDHGNVNYVLKDSRNNEITKGELPLNLFGGFDTNIKLPATMNLGEASLELEATGAKSMNGRSASHRLQVQEFRRPEFEVKARTVTDGPFFVGDYAEAVVSATYFAGGALPGAEVQWHVSAAPANFTPPNRDDFSFGNWSAWWEPSNDYDGTIDHDFKSQTDQAGTHRLRMTFDSVKPARASSVTAQASVEDVNRQTWSSSVTLLVHAADLYVGLRSKNVFVQKGEPLIVESVVTDLDGKQVAGREIRMRSVLLEWKQVNGEWTVIETKPQDCSQRSTHEVVRCTFASNEGGAYRVTASITDERGRRNESELRLWVAGGKTPRSNVESDKVELIPKSKEYKPGDIAEVLVNAPFFPAEGLMSLRRSGIVKVEHFHLDGPTHTLRIPIEEGWTPNVHLQVDLVGQKERESGDEDRPVAAGTPKQPALASGEINLAIPPLSRRLNVTATPADLTLEPGSQTSVSLEVKDASGGPSKNAEVAVVVVDESVLAMTNYRLRDPLSVFYSERDAEVSDYHSRESLVLSEDIGAGSGGGFASTVAGLTETVNVMASRSNNFVLDGLSALAKSGTDEPKLGLRKDFNALAVFAPSVHTDANGHAKVTVKLPDNLTRYRVLAVAVDAGNHFGAGESAITARSPLMVRPSAPRFLNFGDRFELPVVVQNQTDLPMTVDLALRARNATFPPLRNAPSTMATVGGPASSEVSIAGRRLTVPANNRVEVRVPAAAMRTGIARFQIAVSSDSASDAAEISLPVWTPATTEAFATYGQLDDGVISQTVKAPVGVVPDFGGLEVQTSSTQLQELTDAFLYLQNYPFECSEQLASRILSVAALRDVLTAFKAKELPSPAEIEAAVARDLKRLEGMQNDDGGFGFWRNGERSWPFVTLHVAHALARAKAKKFAVPDELLKRTHNYLASIDSHIPAAYGPDARRALAAYALYVRAHMGDRDTGSARRLINDTGLHNLSLEAMGWLLSVLSGDPASNAEVVAIRSHLNNRVTETAGTAHFITSYKDGDYLLLHSDRRGDGIILEALIKDQPESDLIPKLVRGLLAHRTRGRWSNTQENVFILLALDRYFDTYEKATPNFVTRVWLGESYAGEQSFKGRSTDQKQIDIPMQELAKKNSPQELVVSKQGEGRLYYRLGMQYAPANLSLKPADYGFIVKRSYEVLDKPDDVKQDADGTWRIRAGARVRVRVTMVAPARRYHVALVDPLPAGFETLNPELVVTGNLPEDEERTGVMEISSRMYGRDSQRWRTVWFEHQNFRDERTEAFASLLWDGVYNYTYVARATTPGLFIVPPAKAEEMYHPETFGRGRTDRVIIE